MSAAQPDDDPYRDLAGVHFRCIAEDEDGEPLVLEFSHYVAPETGIEPPHELGIEPLPK